LMVDGTTILSEDGNDVTTLSALNGGQIIYRDATSVTIGSVTVDGMTITGVETTGTGDLGVSTVDGTITVNEHITVADGAISLRANGTISDIAINNAVTATTGAISIVADDSISFSAAGNVVANGPGNVTLTANAVDTAGNNGDGITMADNSFVNAGTGQILLTSTGVNGGTIIAEDLTTNGDLIQLDATRNIEIGNGSGATLKAEDANTATSESILISAGMNITVHTGSILSTDDMPGSSDETLTGDQIHLTADSDNNAAPMVTDTNMNGKFDPAEVAVVTDGLVTLGTSVQIITDGGIATTFVNRPGTGVGTAFFNYGGTAIPSTITQDLGTLSYKVAFQITINSTGEENLRIDIDWRDPNVAAFDH
ncbi:MAG: hypothetical protein KDA85_08635, partial [Planctomycetaceae bacterium]|nr:hypothetical protein [Planctomycetaceae bacterium]